MKKRSWKTTLFGASSVLAGVVLILKGNVVEGCATILSGLGLVTAKDYDATHSNQ